MLALFYGCKLSYQINVLFASFLCANFVPDHSLLKMSYEINILFVFLQIVVPHHRSPLFVIFLSDHRPICLFVIIIIPHHRPFCLFFANCCSNKMQQTFMNDLLPEIIAHINQNCHNQQWCAFFKLVYFLA